jgi:hypothetical protein
MNREQYKELCSHIEDISQMAGALEGARLALGRIVKSLNALLKGAKAQEARRG